MIGDRETVFHAMPSSSSSETRPLPVSTSPPSTPSPALDAGETEKVSPPNEAGEPVVKKHKGLRFWLIILSCCVIDFSTALDATIITTALPKITIELHGQSKYVWLANTYVFSSTSVMPFVGQTSNIFGRRMPMIISVILFTIGNALAGASVNAAMLIGARTVTGLGGGGIFVLNDLIISDLVPVRERAQ